MTDEELQAIRGRAEQATPGPWKAGEGFREWHLYGADGITVGETYAHRRGAEANRTFMAHAREDIPALLDENAALREIARKLAELNIREASDTVWAIVSVDVVRQARKLLGTEQGATE